jgi:hypothetical protein
MQCLPKRKSGLKCDQKKSKIILEANHNIFMGLQKAIVEQDKRWGT